MPGKTTATHADDDQARAHLSAMISASGLSLAAFARAIGVDRGTVGDWLTGAKGLPDSRRQWLAALDRVDATVERVSVVTRRQSGA